MTTLYVTGNTFPRKDVIKSAGFRWDGSTRAWTKPLDPKHSAALVRALNREDGARNEFAAMVGAKLPEIQLAARLDDGTFAVLFASKSYAAWESREAARLHDVI